MNPKTGLEEETCDGNDSNYKHVHTCAALGLGPCFFLVPDLDRLRPLLRFFAKSHSFSSSVAGCLEALVGCLVVGSDSLAGAFDCLATGVSTGGFFSFDCTSAGRFLQSVDFVRVDLRPGKECGRGLFIFFVPGFVTCHP